MSETCSKKAERHTPETRHFYSTYFPSKIEKKSAFITDLFFAVNVWMLQKHDILSLEILKSALNLIEKIINGGGDACDILIITSQVFSFNKKQSI